jgi:hypothetical protein
VHVFRVKDFKVSGDFSPPFYFLGFGGLFSAGPLVLPGLVLGLGGCTIGFFAMICTIDVMPTLFAFRLSQLHF